MIKETQRKHRIAIFVLLASFIAYMIIPYNYIRYTETNKDVACLVQSGIAYTNGTHTLECKDAEGNIKDRTVDSDTYDNTAVGKTIYFVDSSSTIFFDQHPFRSFIGFILTCILVAIIVILAFALGGIYLQTVFGRPTPPVKLE